MFSIKGKIDFFKGHFRKGSNDCKKKETKVINLNSFFFNLNFKNPNVEIQIYYENQNNHIFIQILIKKGSNGLYD